MTREAWIVAIGTGAAVCSMASFIPQVTKLVRERDASSVSMRMYVVTVIGFSLWAVYGLLLHSWPLTLSNLISLTLSGVILFLKLRHGGSSARSPQGRGFPPRLSVFRHFGRLLGRS